VCRWGVPFLSFFFLNVASQRSTCGRSRNVRERNHMPTRTFVRARVCQRSVQDARCAYACAATARIYQEVRSAAVVPCACF